MVVTNIPNFALLSYFTIDRFYYQLYGHLAPVFENDRRDGVEYGSSNLQNGLADYLVCNLEKV